MDYSLWAWNLSGSEKELPVSSPFSILACLPSESSLVPWCVELSHSDVGKSAALHVHIHSQVEVKNWTNPPLVLQPQENSAHEHYSPLRSTGMSSPCVLEPVIFDSHIFSSSFQTC